LVFLALPTTARRQSEEIIPFETIVKYVYGGPVDVETPTGYVARNRKEWKRVWKLAHSTFLVKPPLPEIDFDNRMVLAVFHGYTGGSCSTSITSIVKTEEGLQVHAKQTCPGITCGPQPANVLKPVEIVTIERLEKSISKKDPNLIVELSFFECNPPR
jgi:hypothetical protein